MRIFGKDINCVSLNISKIQHEYNEKNNLQSSYRRFNNNTNYKEQEPININPYLGHYMNNYRFRSKSIMFITDDELGTDNDLVQFFNNLKRNKIDIKPEDKIYFCKSSSYPRHRLANFTDNKRTIKTDKADYIVVPNEGFEFYTKDEDIDFIFKDINTDKFYKIYSGRSYIYGMTEKSMIDFAANNYLKNPYNIKTKEDFIKQYLKETLGSEFELVPFKKLVFDSGNFKDDIFDLYNNYSDKLITENQLDTYINSQGEVIDLDQEKFEMLNKMLADKTGQSVGLALRMMNSFDSTKHLIPLSLLMLFNIRNISRNKEWNTVGMKVLRNKLPFITTYTADSTKSTINVLNRLTRDFCKTEEDREKIKKYGMPMIKGVVDNFIERELKEVSFIDKYDIILE